MKRFSMPQMSDELLENGLRLIVMPDHEQCGVCMFFETDVGRLSSLVGLEGTAEITASLMQKGCKRLGAERFMHGLENAGVVLHADVGDESTMFGCKTLADKAEQIFPLFWEMITDPALDEKELDRLKKEMATGLQAEWSDPSSLSQRHFTAELFGKKNPSGRQVTAASVKRISTQSIQQFYSGYYAPKGAIVVIAGDITVEKVNALWRPLFAAWRHERTLTPHASLPHSGSTGRVLRIVDKPDLTQTTLVIGFAVAGELHPEHQPMALANYILGGGNFSSRLLEFVRASQGKTYGISSSLSCNHASGVFTISTSTQNAQLGRVFESIGNIYDEFVDKGVEAEELNKAKEYAKGSMALQLEGIVNVADKLLWLHSIGRETRWLEEYGSRMDAIDQARMNRVIAEHFVKNSGVVVAVGKKSEILKQLGRFTFSRQKTFNFRQDP